jgi:hypothetical protein
MADCCNLVYPAFARELVSIPVELRTNVLEFTPRNAGIELELAQKESRTPKRTGLTVRVFANDCVNSDFCDFSVSCRQLVYYTPIWKREDFFSIC